MTLVVLVFLGGMLTILSPCILPVLPFVFARADQPFLRSGLPLLAGMALTFAAVATLAAVGGVAAVGGRAGMVRVGMCSSAPTDESHGRSELSPLRTDHVNA